MYKEVNAVATHTSPEAKEVDAAAIMSLIKTHFCDVDGKCLHTFYTCAQNRCDSVKSVTSL